MKLDKKKLMIIGGVLLAVGIGVYLWRRRSAGQPETIDVDAEILDDGAVTKSGTSTSTVDISSDERYSAPVRNDLKWIKNEAVARYLSNLLSPSDGTRLRGWFQMINKQKVDSGGTKWKDSDGMTGDVHTIASSLYQMKSQTNTLRKSKDKADIEKAKNHTDPNKIWSNEVKFALQDAQ